jgi:hypothetical protein
MKGERAVDIRFASGGEKRNDRACGIFLSLMAAAGTGLGERGETFTRREGRKTHVFTWLPFDRLASEYFYPRFLKTEIYDLPERFALRTEVE